VSFSCIRKIPPRIVSKLKASRLLKNKILEEYDRVVVSHLDAALWPVGPFIATIEASEKVTSSLVIATTFAIIHATSKDVPV